MSWLMLDQLENIITVSLYFDFLFQINSYYLFNESVVKINTNISLLHLMSVLRYRIVQMGYLNHPIILPQQALEHELPLTSLFSL